MNNNYKFSGIPLKRSIATELILDFYADKGKAFSVSEIRETVLEYHVENGGDPPTGDLKSIIRSAIRFLKDSEYAEQVVLGYWRFSNPEDNPKDETKIIGSGSGTVYVYYFPKDRENAKSKKDSSWECKIGKADDDPDKRIEEQIRKSPTALSEEPVKPLFIKTDRPKEVEDAIHAILIAQGKHKKDAPGNEWFITSPDEVEDIYRKNFE